jgi:deazaflavin-dependent oxidoreductase (nitroreductase family)
MRAPRFFWRIIQNGPRLAYALGLGPLVGRFVLLLTTRGCKTGLPRTIPLVYERYGEDYLVASARGHSADWLRNIRAHPEVQVQVGKRLFAATAVVTSDAELVADYLQRQFERSPRMFGAVLRSEGLSLPPTRAELVSLAANRPMVMVSPEEKPA